MQQRNAVLVHGNALRLGLFGANCASGRTYATLAERWEASWENNVSLARLADEVGIECMIPIARWKGYGGASNPNGSSFEAIAWACGLLAATRHINVFCTVHVPLHHPLVAAKQMATADHIGQGRFGVNLVCGWNEDEFQMFGVTPHEHDERYVAEEGERSQDQHGAEHARERRDVHGNHTEEHQHGGKDEHRGTDRDPAPAVTPFRRAHALRRTAHVAEIVLRHFELDYAEGHEDASGQEA